MNEENDGEKRLLVVFIAAVAVGATVALVFIFQFSEMPSGSGATFI